MAPYWHTYFLSSPPLRVTKMYVLPYVLALLLFCTFCSTPILGPSSLCLHSDLAPLCFQVGSTWACIGTVFPPPSDHGVCIRAPLLLHLRSDLTPTCPSHAPAWTHKHLGLDSSWPPLAPHFGPILDKSWPHFAPLGAETLRKGYLLLHLLPPLLFAHLGLSWATLGPSWLQLCFIVAPTWPILPPYRLPLGLIPARSWLRLALFCPQSGPQATPLLALSRPHFASILASLRPPERRNCGKRVPFIASGATPPVRTPWPLLGHLGAIFAPTWTHLGTILASGWSPLGPISHRFASILAASWPHHNSF